MRDPFGCWDGGVAGDEEEEAGDDGEDGDFVVDAEAVGLSEDGEA